MSKIQFKRGLEADRLNQSPAFVPDAGEPIWVTDKNTLYVGDGSTEGGVPVSKGLDVLYTQTVDNPNPSTNSISNQFGLSVGVSGNYGIVGVPGDDTPARDSGRAYIYDVTTGFIVHDLDNPNAYDTSQSDFFGWSVAISGNYAIVGAYGEDDVSGTTSGKAYIYDVTTGTLLYTLDNPNAQDTSSNDYFGYSVAISGKYVIVGAYRENDATSPGTQSGKAYIYDISTFTSSTISSANYTLNNPNAYDTPANDRFGNAVGISGRYAIVGSYQEDEATTAETGKAYIYDISTFTTTTISSANYTLDNPNPNSPIPADWFGWSVAISGNYAIVSSYEAGGSASGKAYIYDISTFTSSTISSANYVLNNPNVYGSPNNDLFGYSVSISGNYAVVGASGEDETLSITGAGKAYIYDISTFTSSTISSANYVLDNPDATSPATGDAFGSSVAISGNYIIVGAPGEDEDSSPVINSSGKAYIFKTNGQDPTYTGAEIASFANPTATATRTVTEFTATASQTEFTGLSYEVGYVDVHYNGSQLESTEFTATNGTSITLTTAATAGAVVRVTAWKLAEFLSSGITTEEFTMTGGETSITVDYNVGAIRFLRSGTLQASADFTATNGTSISFSPAAFAGELITVEKLNQITDSLGSADIGVTVQGYDATLLNSADIGVTVQAYDADTAKYDDVTANFTGTLQNGGSNVVVDSDIGVTVQAYDATILNSADIGSSVQAYNSDLTTFLGSFDLGYRNVPAVGTQTGSYTLATGDVGKYVQVGTGGSITIPDATFSEGDVVSIFNNTTGNITITCSITTAYIGGEDADKASVTLATRGVATVFFISGTVCVITGNVS